MSFRTSWQAPASVTVSFFETVHERLDKKLTKAYHTVQEAIREKRVHPRGWRQWWWAWFAFWRPANSEDGCEERFSPVKTGFR